MTKQPTLFPKDEIPRTPRKVMMHVIDAGDHGCGGTEPGEQWVKYGCSTCDEESEWQSARSITEARKGIPCPRCNTEEKVNA